MKNLAKLAFAALFALTIVAAPSAQAQVQANMYIAVSDNAYSNAYINLPVGTTVTWTNTGHNQHSVVADDGSFDSGILSPNQAFTRTFNTVGTFRYYDRFYGGSGGVGMYATIIVGNGNGGGLYPACSPSTQNVNLNNSVQFSATGGNGSYAWNATNGSPSFGSGSYFTTSFYLSGTQTVTVSSNGYTSQCTVYVGGNYYPGNNGTLTCSPSTQIANLNDFVSFSASGGNGNYYWIVGNANPSIGSGQTFGTRFTSVGNQIVTLTSGGQSSQCVVQVSGGQVLGVSDVSTGPEDAALWAIVFGLLAALIAYGIAFLEYPKKLIALVSRR